MLCVLLNLLMNMLKFILKLFLVLQNTLAYIREYAMIPVMFINIAFTYAVTSNQGAIWYLSLAYTYKWL